jgi:hypothetical protein
MSKNSGIRTVFTIILVFSALSSLSAINPVDLYDSIYTYVDRWVSAGLIEEVPMIKPYSLQVLRSVLEEVVENPRSPDYDKEKANQLLNELFRDAKLRFEASHESRTLFNGSDFNYTGITGIGGSLNWEIDPLISASFLLNPFLIDYSDGSSLLQNTREPADWIPDDSDIDIFGRKYLIQTRLLSNFTVGTPDLYASLGFSRIALKDFSRLNIVFSQESPYKPNFQFHWGGDNISFDFLYAPISASNNSGEGLNPDKHLVFHSIGGKIADWLHISFFETVIYGERFDFTYFIPFSSFFLNQGFTGFEDNALMGFSLEFQPSSEFSIPFYLYVDDVHFNDIIRFDFDTKYKLAAQLGFNWTPNDEVFKDLKFVATAIMPYMYTHRDGELQEVNFLNPSKVNYSNYTHFGSNIGPSFNPNTLNLTLSNTLTLANFLDMISTLSYSIHGNASDGIINNATGTGDIFDPGYDGGSATFQSTTRFLIQDVLEHTFQLAIRLETGLFFEDFYLEPSFEYGFEYIYNKDLVEGQTEFNNFISLSLGFTW